MEFALAVVKLLQGRPSALVPPNQHHRALLGHAQIADHIVELAGAGEHRWIAILEFALPAEHAPAAGLLLGQLAAPPGAHAVRTIQRAGMAAVGAVLVFCLDAEDARVFGRVDELVQLGRIAMRKQGAQQRSAVAVASGHAGLGIGNEFGDAGEIPGDGLTDGLSLGTG